MVSLEFNTALAGCGQTDVLILATDLLIGPHSTHYVSFPTPLIGVNASFDLFDVEADCRKIAKTNGGTSVFNPSLLLSIIFLCHSVSLAAASPCERLPLLPSLQKLDRRTSLNDNS